MIILGGKRLLLKWCVKYQLVLAGWYIQEVKKKNSWPTSTKGFLGSPFCLQRLTRNFIFPWTEKSPLLPSTPWSLRSFWKFASDPEIIPWFLTKSKQRSFSATSPHREDTFLFFPPRQASYYRRSEFLTERCLLPFSSVPFRCRLHHFLSRLCCRNTGHDLWSLNINMMPDRKRATY